VRPTHRHFDDPSVDVWGAAPGPGPPGRRPHSTHQLVAPNSLRSRSLELLLKEVRAGELDDREALEIHERLTELKVRLLGDRVSRRTAWGLARQFDWKNLADAECLAVTKLQADALVTIDAELASKAADVVPLAPLDHIFTE
jgi:predicted nucleic acid-binding protein